MRKARAAGLVSLLTVALPAIAATPSPSFVGAWVVVWPGDPRLDGLSAAGPESRSPNAPGLLLAVPAAEFASPLSESSARTLVAAARQAGWKSGLAVDLPDTDVPKDPRAAEAWTPERLYPGLGRLLEAARGADLFVLRFPTLEEEDLPARRFALRKIAASIRAENPSARIALVFHRVPGEAPFPPVARALLADDLAAYLDLIGLYAESPLPEPAELRSAAEALGIERPLVLLAPPLPDAAALLDLAARAAPEGIRVVAAPVTAPGTADRLLLRFGRILDGDFGADARASKVETASGQRLSAYRFVSGIDLGGVVLVPGVEPAGPPVRSAIRLTLDASTYSAFEVHELATGRSGRFEIPPTRDAPTLTLSTAAGPIAVVLTARERSAAEAPRARVEATAERGTTVEEILARHQVWRAARDLRWTRFLARNETSIQFRFVDLNSTLNLTLAGPYFFEKGKGSDWVWHEAYINGVRWRGKRVPELPLIQPEKVSELPLSLTFDDSYVYELAGQETVLGTACWVLAFTPKAGASDRPLYAGTVEISKADFSVVRVRSKQLNLTGEMLTVDQETEFGPVRPADGGPPLLFPTHQRSRWVLNTFSGTTMLESETRLLDVRIDPPDWDTVLAAASSSDDVMVRDTEKGMRYLEKTKEGERVVVEKPKTSRLFGLAGVYWDASFNFPLPLLGVFYIDLDFRNKQQQLQVFFGGPLLLASFNEPRLFGTKFSLGANVFGVAFRGSNFWYENGVEDPSQQVKDRSSAANVFLGVPVVRHLRATLTVGVSYRDFGAASDTSPDFAIPSNGATLRLSADLFWNVWGWAVSGSYGWFKRSAWGPWGYAGNPQWDPSKTEYRLYGVTAAKDFPLSGFRLVKLGASWFGSGNTDRFSEYTFGSFGGTPLEGFSTGNLRAQEAIVVRGAYGYVFGNTFRILAAYEQAWVTDEYVGYTRVPFAGAGITSEMPGPWSTIVRFDAGLPVVGRNRGTKGGVVNLTFLKFF
ncbi:MAG TPA: hypothetical protein VL084_12680 [Thermoanaerobaculia bacterium]|nr:hypothetical protein [Thermoanaerobaculia bacterium]